MRTASGRAFSLYFLSGNFERSVLLLLRLLRSEINSVRDVMRLVRRSLRRKVAYEVNGVLDLVCFTSVVSRVRFVNSDGARRRAADSVVSSVGDVLGEDVT